MSNVLGEIWTGPPKLILGIDIGLDESAASVAYLYPNGPLFSLQVSAWPGQEAEKGKKTVPTRLFYDKNRNAVSFGAETLVPRVLEQAEEEGWQLARHFKQYLNPDATMQRKSLQEQLITTGIPLHQIYTDFMVYLLKHIQEYFSSRTLDGQRIWKDLHEDMTIIIAHPSGWTVKEHNFLRKAVIAANYTSEVKSHTHVQFISEAEASVHFFILHSELGDQLHRNVDFLLCDAGGTTVDVTSYCVKTVSPMLQLEENKVSACIRAGGTFVDLECEKHLADILNSLGLPDEEREDYLYNGVRDFVRSAKREFETVDSDYRVDLGCRLMRPDLRIRRGIITLSGGVIKSFFNRCVNDIITCIKHQISGLQPTHILLSGEFGNSRYLRQALLSEFRGTACIITTTDLSSSNAVAVGTVMWGAKLICASQTTHSSYSDGLNNSYKPKHYDYQTHASTAETLFTGTGLQKKTITISSNMQAHEIVFHLVANRCQDVTEQLDLATCGTSPIAGGGFGDIYQGMLIGGQKVAIKCPRLYLKQGETGHKVLKNIARELYAWSSLNHPNVMELIGLSIFRDQISMVSPWMENGTLTEYIGQNPAASRFQLCAQIAAGLAHLHEMGTVHGDIKGLNVLVSGTGTAKLADFGNTIIQKCTLEFTGTTSASKVSVRWTCPEVLQGKSMYTKEADVYALGMTFLEIITGKVPFSDKRDEAVIVQVLMTRKYPKRPQELDLMDEKEAQLLWKIMPRCWAHDPVHRPSALEVESHLNEVGGDQAWLSNRHRKSLKNSLGVFGRFWDLTRRV